MFTLDGFTAHLAAVAAQMEHEKRHAVELGCLIIEEEAKSAIGTYKYGWPTLAASTLARKSADTPLLQTGALRDSITHTVESNSSGVVFSNDPKAGWHEFGTARIPPRPFLGTAADVKGEEAARVMAEAALRPLLLAAV